MRVEQVALPTHKFTLVEYDSARDLMKQTERGDKLRGGRYSAASQSEWAGGTYDYFQRGLRGAVSDYTKRADKLVTQFGNIALEDYSVTIESNLTQGVLDYNAAMAGDPMCMYGTTVDMTDRSPVEIYVDPWMSGGIEPAAIERRGIAILALVQALSVFRPVNTLVLKASKHAPAQANTVQTLPIPTMPMDLSKASFMLCSPTVNRHGFLSAINSAHNTKRKCGSPQVSGNWPKTEMAAWYANRRGVKDYLHMHGMWKNGIWGDNAATLAWVKAQVAKFVGKINR